jgi:hypothetical protein
MSAETDQFATDAEAHETETVTIDGVDYPCRFTPFFKSDKLQSGGWTADYEASIYVRQSLFATIPKVGSTVTIGGNDFQISGKMIPPDNVDIELKLVSTS